MASTVGPIAFLALRPEPGNVREARQAVARAADAAGASPDRVGGLMVAVSEACTNAIESHVAAHDPTPVAVQVLRERAELVVLIEDHGHGFDPAGRPPRPPVGDPEHLRIERGWGIQLMHALVDQLSFERTALGMKVRLVIDVPPM